MTAAAAKQELIVFVHGFGSSQACWNPLLDLLRKRPEITGRFELACFEYETKILNFHFLKRIPRLEELAAQLDAYLESAELRRYSQVTLVGHSQGGLVIQSYVAAKLGSDRSRLERIRQILMIATPHLGSKIVSKLRELVFWFFENPQERFMRSYNPYAAELVSRIRNNVDRANSDGEGCWRIPIHCFSGTSDRVVLEASAKGQYTNTTSIPGDHFTVIQPGSQEDQRFLRILEAICEPVGHPTMWEIDHFEVELQVHPLRGKDRQVQVRHGVRERVVETDNRARMIRKVTFSPKNRCQDSFALLRYHTEGHGYVRFDVDGDENAWLPEEKDAYDAHGRNAVFRFIPKAGRNYTFDAEIWGGYTRHPNEDNLHAHFHLGRRLARYRKVTLTLDLSDFVRERGGPVRGPELYFHARDSSHSEACRRRRPEDRIPCLRHDEKGRWTWELQHVTGGIADIAWDIPVAESNLRSPETSLS